MPHDLIQAVTIAKLDDIHKHRNPTSLLQCLKIIIIEEIVDLPKPTDVFLRSPTHTRQQDGLGDDEVPVVRFWDIPNATVDVTENLLVCELCQRITDKSLSPDIDAVEPFILDQDDCVCQALVEVLVTAELRAGQVPFEGSFEEVSGVTKYLICFLTDPTILRIDEVMVGVVPCSVWTLGFFERGTVEVDDARLFEAWFDDECADGDWV